MRANGKGRRGRKERGPGGAERNERRGDDGKLSEGDVMTRGGGEQTVWLRRWGGGGKEDEYEVWVEEVGKNGGSEVGG